MLALVACGVLMSCKDNVPPEAVARDAWVLATRYGDLTAIAGLDRIPPEKMRQLMETAVSLGDVHLLETLRRFVPESDLPDFLESAVITEKEEIVETLIDVGVPVHEELLAHAIYFGNMRIAERVGAAVTAPSEEWVRKLAVVAIRARRPVMIDFLFDRYAPAATAVVSDFRVSKEALVRGGVESLTRLLEAGADVRQTDEHGDTLLHIAANIGEVAIARFLVESGAPVNAQNHFGLTPLMLASLRGNSVLAAMLLGAGAHLDLTAIDGRRAIEFASPLLSPEVRNQLRGSPH